MLWSQSDLERLHQNIEFHLPALVNAGDADPLTVGLLCQASSAVKATLLRLAPPDAAPADDEDEEEAPKPARKPRAAKPAAGGKAAACSMGERHRFKDGVCKCGASKGGGPVAAVAGVTKVDPPSRTLPAMAVHYFGGGVPDVSPCGRVLSATMQAARTDQPDEVTCPECMRGLGL